MRNNILTIIKKECRRFFGDKRMVLTTIILPALLFYAIYSLMGSGMLKSYTIEEDYRYQCYVQNMPESVAPLFDGQFFEMTSTTDPEMAKQAIQDKNADIFVVFPENFDEKIQNPETVAEALNVEAYYSSAFTSSWSAYTDFESIMDLYESSLVNLLDINNGVDADLASTQDMITSFAASMLPMMVMLVLSMGCIVISLESIAAEKEKGTFATLLVTPVRRTDIAIGKVISLSLFSLLSGLATFLAMILSLPKLVGSDISLNVYTTGDYVCLLGIVLSTILLTVSIASIVSAFAQNTKQASSSQLLFLFVFMGVGILPMFSADLTGFGWNLIPVLNSVLCLDGIFSFNYSVTDVVVSCVSNLVYMGIFTVVLAKMFNSEKIMFNKG